MLAVYFWHSEGSTVSCEQLMKAVLRRVANTKSPGIIACDASMELLGFKLGDWYKEGKALVEAPAFGVTMYRA